MIARSDSQGVNCPFCSSNQTELALLFGQQLLTAQYYCRTCRTPFERVKGRDVVDEASRESDDGDDWSGR